MYMASFCVTPEDCGEGKDDGWGEGKGEEGREKGRRKTVN